MRRVLVVSAALVLAAASPPAAAAPIPEGPDADKLDPFVGRPAVPKPVAFPAVPRHPFMAPNGRSNLHEDAWMSDVHGPIGPLGRRPERTSSFLEGVCASITFDSRGRIVTVCVGVEGPKLVMLDPRTLETLALMPLPPRMPGGGGSVFQDFAGGGYFYLDQGDRAVIPTTSRHLYVVQAKDPPGFERVADHDLTAAVPAGDKIISALPDWSGRIWFASVQGRVGYVASDGKVTHIELGEPIANSFSVDQDGGVYIVSDKALYRFDLDGSGKPVATWREEYANTGVQKPGQSSPGSGTTPTVMHGGFVAITDNADPINVLVYRRARTVSGPRLVCRQPVFEKGASATDQSLIATERSIVVENNHGYTGPTATQDGKTTKPGLERVDLTSGGCRSVWRSPEVAPSAVPKLSADAGLVYTYTKEAREDGVDAWYFTAIDFHTGRTVFKTLGGEGLGHNNNYAPITIGPDNAMYIGVLGGIVMTRDTSGPASATVARRTDLRLRVRRTRSGRVLAWLRGRHVRRVRAVRFYVGRRSLGDGRFPWRRALNRRAYRRATMVRAKVRMRDGRTLRLTRRYRRAR